MTREEAIEKLHWFALDNRDKQIIDTAIEVLTSQNLTKPNNTCEVDPISRQDAMEAVRKVWYNNDDRNDFKQKYYEMGNNDAVEDALGEIKELPTVVASTEFLISRYDAKDKAKEIMYSILDDTDYNDIKSMAHALLMMKIKILKMFDEFPSAEAIPLRKDCAECALKAINRPKLNEESYERGYTAGQMAGRPKGLWTITTTDDGEGGEVPHLICSECGNEPMAWSVRQFFNFCPNCGADMRGEEE